MVSETLANGSRERTQPTMALDQSALLEVLEMLKAAPDVGTGAANDVTHSSRIKGSGAAAVDRFVDRAICATSALRAIGGAAPWYPCS